MKGTGFFNTKKKLKFTIFSLSVHCGIAAAMLANKHFDSGVWGLWFASFNTSIGVFAKFNHDDKKIRIENEGVK